MQSIEEALKIAGAEDDLQIILQVLEGESVGFKRHEAAAGPFANMDTAMLTGLNIRKLSVIRRAQQQQQQDQGKLYVTLLALLTLLSLMLSTCFSMLSQPTAWWLVLWSLLALDELIYGFGACSLSASSVAYGFTNNLAGCICTKLTSTFTAESQPCLWLDGLLLIS